MQLTDASCKPVRATVLNFEVRNFHFLVETLTAEATAACSAILSEEVRAAVNETEGIVLSPAYPASAFFTGPAHALRGLVAALGVEARWRSRASELGDNLASALVSAVHSDAFMLIGGT